MVSRVFRFLLAASAVVLIFALSVVWRIDRTPLASQEFFAGMTHSLDSLQPEIATSNGKLTSGWRRVNITPMHVMPMAGYTLRKQFHTVRDSLYANILLVGNGEATAAFVNVDLLLFPPALRDKLVAQTSDLNLFLYLSATHTHNGVGGWDDGLMGRLALGDYNEEWVDSVATVIASGLRSTDLLPARMNYWESDLSSWVENRINMDSGATDGILRGLTVKRADSSTAQLFTFSAHPTSIGRRELMLSADYPGAVIRELEATSDFAMFMSGMVGSHRFSSLTEEGEALLSREAAIVSTAIPGKVMTTMDSVTMRAAHIPITFGASQMRIEKEWRLRDWVFQVANRPLKGELTWLEVGNIVFIGTPCDFSGEIFTNEKLGAEAARAGKHLVITSFNGDYVGYITDDRNYDISTAEEVRGLNWVGPYHGDYFSTMIRKLLAK